MFFEPCLKVKKAYIYNEKEKGKKTTKKNSKKSSVKQWNFSNKKLFWKILLTKQKAYNIIINADFN